MAAAEEHGARTVGVAGGVALNGALRRAFEEACSGSGIAVAWPGEGLCGDNGAMIAALGAALLDAGENHGLGFDAEARVIRRRPKK